MATFVFDTRQAVRKLQAAGFAEAQADAVVDTLAGAFSDTVATKTDIAELKAEMFRALWIQGGGIVALIVGLLKFT